VRREELAMSVTTVRRILVPVDFSPCARAALDYAAQLAEGMGATFDVLYVHEPGGYAVGDSLTIAPYAQRASQPWDEVHRDTSSELDGFLGALRPRVNAVRIEPGLPSEVIASVAKDGAYDLVVMGTHGRSGIPRLVVGSVAEAVMRKATVPVLTLRLPKKEPRERIPL
jgi:universal stress protein A